MSNRVVWLVEGRVHRSRRFDALGVERYGLATRRGRSRTPAGQDGIWWVYIDPNPPVGWLIRTRYSVPRWIVCNRGPRPVMHG